jgi:hypothetical protein
LDLLYFSEWLEGKIRKQMCNMFWKVQGCQVSEAHPYNPSHLGRSDQEDREIRNQPWQMALETLS